MSSEQQCSTPAEMDKHVFLSLGLGGALGIGVSYIADNLMEPALIWGGDLCTDTESVSQSCGVPPAGLAVFLVVCIGLVSYLQRSVIKNE